VEKILRDPWVGTGFAVDTSTIQRLITQSQRGTLEDQVLPFAVGSAWHNTWLGYAADFGIPASILVGIILLTVLYRSYRTFKESPPKSMTQTLSLYIFLFAVRDVAFSHTGGHSALDAYGRWWMYGLLVALSLTNQARVTAQQTAKVADGSKSVLDPTLVTQPARLPATVHRPSHS
jgi:O-antigen ligase